MYNWKYKAKEFSKNEKDVLIVKEIIKHNSKFLINPIGNYFTEKWENYLIWKESIEDEKCK
jgi:ribosomal protein S17E